MAGTNVAGGRPSVQQTLQTMNQSMGQLMTFITNQKQIASMEKQQDQGVFDSNFLSNPAIMKMNAQENNAAFRIGMEKHHGLSGDSYELWREGITKMAMLPKDQGTFQMMEGWKEGVENNDWTRLMSIGSSIEGAGLDLPQITDRLDKGFTPPVTGGPTIAKAPPIVTDDEEPDVPPVVEPEPDLEPEVTPEPLVTLPGVENIQNRKAEELATLEKRYEEAQEIMNPAQLKVYEREMEKKRERIENKYTGQLETLQRSQEIDAQVEQKAQDLQVEPANLDKSIREENLFQMQERERNDLDVQIQQLESDINKMPRDRRGPSIQKLEQLKQQRNNISLRDQISKPAVAFIQAGSSMSKYGVGKEIDQPTEKYVREMEGQAVEAKNALLEEKILPGWEDKYIIEKAEATLSDRQAKDIRIAVEKNPLLLQQRQNIERGQAIEQGPLTPAENARGTSAIASLLDKALPRTERQNLLEGLKKVDPVVLGEFFPAAFDRQLQLNDQQIRVAQQRINAKLANTQQYQVMMQAYYQSLQDQLIPGDPMAGKLLDAGVQQLEIISKGLDWTDPKDAQKAFDEALKTNAIAGAAFKILQQWYTDAGVGFTIEEYRKGFLWLQSVQRVEMNITQNMPGNVPDNAITGEGAFDPNAFLD